MVMCLVYIGVIVMLHIFGKVKSHKSAVNIPTPDIEPDLDVEPEFTNPDPEPEPDKESDEL